MKVFGVDFAPLNVPMERRLQTLASTTFVLVVLAVPLSICLTFLLFIFGSQWIQLLFILYILFICYDRNVHMRGGRGTWGVRWLKNNRVWDYSCKYFPIELVKTAELDPSKNYVFCVFPHGLIALGTGACFVTGGASCEQIFPGLEFRLILLNIHFLIPFFREFVLCMGCCGSSAKSIKYLLSTKPTKSINSTKDSKQGRAVVLLVGGTTEALKSQPGVYRIVLKQRKGFVRIALQHGSPLVPVFSFGENDYYDQLHFPEGSVLQEIQKSFKNVMGFAPTLINGRGFFQYSFGILPRRNPINIVVGSPVEIPKIERPTDEEVDEFHEKFMNKLIELFETHKCKYVKNYENISLIIE